MSDKKFLLSLFILTGLLVSLASFINYYVDPGGAFHKGKLLEERSAEYVEKLLGAKVGVKLQGQSRSTKYHLFKHHQNFDCLILGSSHVIQLSTLTVNSSLKKLCSSSLNLGIGGGNLEDLLVFLHFIQKSEYKGKIFIGIDPWTLKLGINQGYNSYPLSVYEKTSLQENFPDTFYFTDTSFDFKGLTSFDYLKSSLKYLFKTGLNAFELPNIEMKVPESWSIENGFEEGAMLKDGAHVYGIFHTKVHHTDEHYHALGSYGLVGEIWQERAWEVLLSQLQKLSLRNEINILLMPYHPNVFKHSNQKYLAYIVAVEKRVREEMKKIEIRVIGTYDSSTLGCLPTEFYDAEHANIFCLNRIDFKEGQDGK